MKTEWDFSHLIKGDLKKQIEQEKEKIKISIESFEKKWKQDKSYLENAERLLFALDELEKISSTLGTFGDTGYYLNLQLNAFPVKEELKADYSKLNDFSTEMGNKLEFFTNTLSKISENKQKEFLNNKSLNEYHHFLEKLFMAGKYILSEKEEKILSLKSVPSYENWLELTEETLAKKSRKISLEKEEEKNLAELLELTENKDKKIRDSAAKEINKILEECKDIATAEINAILKNKQINDELRGYNRADSSRLIADDIDEEWIDTLLSTAKKNYDLSRRFYELKAKLLKQKKLLYHERNVRIGNIGGNYSYEETSNIILEIFRELDEDFYKLAKVTIDEGRVDVFPKKGKTSGAFCSIGLKSQPPYIMLNHTGSLKNVQTMAHEFGHMINHELMKKENSLNYNLLTSTGEVASTFMEDFVIEKILKNSDKEARFLIMMQKLNEEISTLIRQPACYLFEKELHSQFREKGHLTSEEIGEIFQKHMSDYMGDFVEQSNGSENWWVYWSHIRRYFYVYSYASGLLLSKVMQGMIRENKKNISKIKEFLSSGGSRSPRQIFKSLNIEINADLWEKGFAELRKLLEETEKIARELGKIK